MLLRSSIIYAVLAVAWAGMAGWQVAEHSRVRRAARAALVNRSRDISTTLGLVIKSQSRFNSRIVSKERMESALNELAGTGELKSVALLNAAGAVVASAGEAIPLEQTTARSGTEFWEPHSVTLVNVVDLGTNSVSGTNTVREGEGNVPILVVPRSELQPGTNTEWRNRWRTNRPPGSAASGPEGSVTNGQASARPPGRPPFGRPPWMSEETFKALIEKQGLHGVVMVMSTEAYHTTTENDFWQRMIIGLLGLLAAGGLAVAWRNAGKTSDLQIRLVRASELNNHLRELNLAAAGLAHETKNPLNIIRGLAQMISKRLDTSEEVRVKSREITDEVDRVTAQLNEFMNYSKPRELRRAPVALAAVIGEVVRALQYDLEDKAIQPVVEADGLTVEADEQQLRQLLFNLLLNAVQAVPSFGHINIVTGATATGEAWLEVRDDGPGLPPDQRLEVFKPYVTSQKHGTGLGLAVVKQIVLAHGWEIECLPNEPKGAIFRLSHLKVLTTAS